MLARSTPRVSTLRSMGDRFDLMEASSARTATGTIRHVRPRDASAVTSALSAATGARRLISARAWSRRPTDPRPTVILPIRPLAQSAVRCVVVFHRPEPSASSRFLPALTGTARSRGDPSRSCCHPAARLPETDEDKSGAVRIAPTPNPAWSLQVTDQRRRDDGGDRPCLPARRVGVSAAVAVSAASA